MSVTTRRVRLPSVAVTRPVAVLAVAALLDLVTTVAGLHHGFVESNPIVATAIATHGVEVLLALKAIAVAVVLAGRWAIPGRSAHLPVVLVASLWLAAGFLNALTILVGAA